MTLAEAVAIVRDQTIPALEERVHRFAASATRLSGQHHVEALRVLLADAEVTLAQGNSCVPAEGAHGGHECD